MIIQEKINILLEVHWEIDAGQPKTMDVTTEVHLMYEETKAPGVK